MADCADVGITRTEDRSELLYPRSKLVTTAKAFGLQAIDLVRLFTALTEIWLICGRYASITKTRKRYGGNAKKA
jgi:hypothetical protein